MESFVEVFGIVFAVALTLVFTTGVALWSDGLFAKKRAHHVRPAAPTPPGGRVAYRRLTWNE